MRRSDAWWSYVSEFGSVNGTLQMVTMSRVRKSPSENPRSDLGSAERVDKAVRVQVPLSCLIRSASAFKPRCTATFTADSDIPLRAAASLTLSPSSFTY
jgi:hypothetical protein